MARTFFPSRQPYIGALIVVLTCTTLLPPYEVEALKEIGRRLQKTDWDFEEDPCSGLSGWITRNPEPGHENNVTCNCTFSNNTVCHVVRIALKSQNLPGVLPPELIKLSYLQEIDLTRNYLNGTLPPEWGSSSLRNISLLANRLVGSIPKEFGNISTLAYLAIEGNQLSGELPTELGNLPSIEYLFLNSNNFVGELPDTFAKLATLKDFRISDNQFNGTLPEFIINWRNLEKLAVQASGLEGPIPNAIANLTNLYDLRITDLYGSESTFPRLNNMNQLHFLLLRNCNISGEIPEYLGSLGPKTGLEVLDLSFNKLSGQIPRNTIQLNASNMIYLTGNLLSGPVPPWMLNEGKQIDLSYNNLTLEGSMGCQQRTVNLFGYSMKSNTYGMASCLRKGNFVCPKDVSSLYINCGGKSLNVGGKNFEADTDPGGPANSYESQTNWAFSSTGHFLDDRNFTDNYILTNKTTLPMKNFGLYTDARASPLSLTYYAFCLSKGTYMVNLYFAEIIFTDDHTYSSLGRRIFDVYIQGNLVLKDFNIEAEAGGAGKEIVKSYLALVNDSTLEIRFYWAGKGTTSIPYRSVYGPLISAISLERNVEHANNIIWVGIAVSVAFAVFIIVGIFWWRGCFRCNNDTELDLNGLDLAAGSYTLRQIKAATNNFSVHNKIGEGGFGPVYKGTLSDGTTIAVKQLSSKSKQGNREFVTEVGMISALQHPHLVKLHGCCAEDNQLLLVYEYMENNSLARALFGDSKCSEENRLKINWPTRHKICIGIARGLAYLHEESRLKIVHRDIKTTNVLLDKDLNPKISDFGLAKLDEQENTHISTRIAGTCGYMAPEYALRGYLTDKADVYSYGVVVLEIVSGIANVVDRTKENRFALLDRAVWLKEMGNLIELVDPRLGREYDEEEVMDVINIGLMCTDLSPTKRPLMSEVVKMLEGRNVVPDVDVDVDPSDKMNGERMWYSKLKSVMTSSSESQTSATVSRVSNWTASSTSSGGADLYPADFHGQGKSSK